MIVYADLRRQEDPRALIARLLARLRGAGAGADLRALLIEAGVVEAAVVDALCPEADDEPPPARGLRAATLDLARAFLGVPAPARGGARRGRGGAARLAEVARGPLPAEVAVAEPEGFAFYALHPEAYAAAARRFARAARPVDATCIGLRSIGTTLAAVVAAALEAEGAAARSFTLRPRGHPWDREARLGPGLRAALAAGAGGHVLVVDEGPGISGTSFACAAEAAAAAGVPDGRIALFPSWDADGAALRSARARERWGRHPRWVVGFEELFVATGRLARPWGGGEPADLSGGLWRARLLPPGRWPAVQPQHERRKYLLPGDGAGPVLLKFAGLGARGDDAFARAARLADAGLAPPALGLADGFLATRFVPGRPAVPEDLDAAMLDAMARHLAHLATTEDPKGPARFDDIVAMTRLNVAEGLGEAAVAETGWMDRMRPAVAARPAIAGDGRMLPHEWLLTPGGVLKCDGTDHHADHFWPQAQDVAWDLAGAAAEWGMDDAAVGALLGRYEALTGDGDARSVLPFYRAAYLAWRLGYAHLATETLGGGEEWARMGALRDRYARALRRALAAGAAGRAAA